jgi:phage tail protein X
MGYYDRYKSFRENGSIDIVPFAKIDEDDTDIRILYNKDTMRMDMLSYKYYGDPNYGWLILQANPHVSSMEYFIPNGASIRIPYPLATAISRYEQSISEWNTENKDR